jgi:hypothetical protein
MKLKDSLFLGIPAGLVGPVVGVLVFYFVNFSNSEFASFFRMAAEQNLLSPLLSLCAVINLGIFFLFIRINHLHSARGIILSTFLYGIVIIGLKFVF